MKRFAALFRELDRSSGTLAKRAALVRYFAEAPPADAAWALWLLSGNKLAAARARIANTRELKQWGAAEAGLAAWLVDDCHHHVGDLAETLALLLPDRADAQADGLPLHRWVEEVLAPVAGQEESVRRDAVVRAWRVLPFHERLLFNKLLTGALRVGVSQGLVQRALADHSGVPIARLAQRLLGDWWPGAAFWRDLLSTEALASDRRQPYPFFLASPVEPASSADADDAPSPDELARRMDAQLGPVQAWLLEWKWDGIRVQLIRRQGEVALWSRGEERLDGRFPEIESALRALPVDAVIDGELLAWSTPEHPGSMAGMAGPRPFLALQPRIQRRKPGARLLAEVPVRVLAYDLLEVEGQDCRAWPLDARRARLAALLAGRPAAMEAAALDLSPSLAVASWGEAAALRAQARERGVEGLMLKRRSAPYQSGRRRGDWWKWKVAPLTIDAVLIYAQSGHGRRSTLYTDYTFGVWEGDTLVPVAKAYSGLDDKEIAALDRWIRAHTVERFGPVRSVEARQVFELGFEAVHDSTRHKSGIAVRFPRILRWRHDKPAAEADRLSTLKALAR